MSTLPPKIITFDEPINYGLIGTSNLWEFNCRRNGLLVSEPHWRLPNGGWSGGGPFYAFHETLFHNKLRVYAKKLGSGGMYSIAGVNLAPTKLPLGPSWLGTVPSWLDVKDAVEAHYATGYARARPGNPVASVGQFIAELRDLPAVPFKRALKGGAQFRDIPRIARKELLDFKNLGSEYLNVVFGWKPFVNDLRKMYNLWHDIDKRMAQIIRENGKYIRRKASVLNEVTSPTSSVTQHAYPWYGMRGAPPNWCTGTTVRRDQTIVRTKVWFSGSFRYYIPDVSSSMWDRRARLALFGALPTPELLWEVLPWSWLVDWFSNVGDVISNASMNAVDNLTSRYSYIMMSKETKTVWHAESSWNGVTPSPYFGGTSISPGSGTTWSELNQVIKCRSGSGNPFGLNVQLSSLSGYQLSILAALGLSRSSVK